MAEVHGQLVDVVSVNAPLAMGQLAPGVESEELGASKVVAVARPDGTLVRSQSPRVPALRTPPQLYLR